MYIQLNGQILYYEKTGEGSPVLLLHGNGETHEIFDVLIPELSKDYTVYAIDTRGHGLSGVPKEYHYMDMANDIAEFIDGLSIEKPAVYGFSDGGIIGLLLAFHYQGKISRLMISGANLNPKDLVHRAYHEMKKRSKKDPEPLTELMLTEPSIDPEDLRMINIPVLVLAGEHDLIKEKVTKKIATMLPNATLKILPGEDHGSYVEHSPKLYPLLADFLQKN